MPTAADTYQALVEARAWGSAALEALRRPRNRRPGVPTADALTYYDILTGPTGEAH